LQIFDAEEHSTHGGSLRLFTQRADIKIHTVTENVIKLRKKEIDSGLNDSAFYKNFQKRADIVKDNFLNFLLRAKEEGKKVIAYGAAAKGNTLLNYAGVRPDLISYVVDKNPNKQGKYMPGSRIPIKGEDYLKGDKVDYVVILPWNLKNEVIEELSYVRKGGGKIVVAVPQLEII